MTRLAAIYSRVSSERQKEERTVASQTAALKEHAVSLGLGVPDEWVFEDEGYSGATLLRPGLERLRDLAAQGQVEIVLCYSPDRLARKYAYQALLFEEFTRVGTEVQFIKGPKAKTPEDELLLQFQGMIAEYERAQIAERTRRGKAHRARSGIVNVLSTAPYGYRYIAKTEMTLASYEIVAHEADVVRRMFCRYVEEQLSIGALTRWLTQERVPTATGKTRWDRSTIWGMLRNPAYCGRAGFCKTMRAEDRPMITRRVRLRGDGIPRRPARRERPREEWIEIPVPAVVSEEVFDLAARRLRDNKRFAARRTKVPSLLQGLLVCQSCGYGYYRTSTKTSARKLYYYRCLGSDDYRYEQGRVCRSLPIRQDYLDALVWTHVVRLLSDPRLIRQELDRRLDELRSAAPATAHKSRMNLELKRTTAAISRLVEAYQEALLDLEELRRRVPELRKRQSHLRTQLAASDAELRSHETYLKLAENMGSFLSRLRSSIDNSSVLERQRILRLVVKEVLVGPRRVVIQHSIPPSSSGSDPDSGTGYLLCGRSRESAAGKPLPALRIRSVDAAELPDDRVGG